MHLSHGGGCCCVIFNAALGGSKPVKMQTKDLNINLKIGDNKDENSCIERL